MPQLPPEHADDGELIICPEFKVACIGTSEQPFGPQTRTNPVSSPVEVAGLAGEVAEEFTSGIAFGIFAVDPQRHEEPEQSVHWQLSEKHASRHGGALSGRGALSSERTESMMSVNIPTTFRYAALANVVRNAVAAFGHALPPSRSPHPASPQSPHELMIFTFRGLSETSLPTPTEWPQKL